MGSSTSLFGFMTEDLLDDYIQLTYLNRVEIVSLLKKFLLMAPDGKIDIESRFSSDVVMEVFPQIKFNPFRDRIFKVFSSLKDNHFSFEDLLDLCSVMSQNCPDNVKAKWAFEMFDFNEDGLIDKEDIIIMTDRLTQGMDPERTIDTEDKEHIVSVLLKAIDIQETGNISRLEFEHAVAKMPDFSSTFWFRI